MKRFIFLSVFICTSGFLFAQNNTSKAEESVKKLIMDSFEDIWSDFDTTKLLTYHTDDFILLENGEVWTNANVKNYMVENLKKGSNVKRKNRFEFIRTERRKRTVWVSYHNYATWTKDGEPAGKAHWLESAVAVKTKKGWRLKLLHSTYIQE